MPEAALIAAVAASTPTCWPAVIGSSRSMYASNRLHVEMTTAPATHSACSVMRSATDSAPPERRSRRSKEAFL
jgi:hypothetical protein